MVLAPYYRRFELPWEDDPQANSRFRRLLWICLGLLVLFLVIVPWIPQPKVEITAEPEVPERLARLMVQEKPKPPPPPPKPVEAEKPKEEPKPVPVPEQRVEQARKKAEKQLSQVRNQLADIQKQFAETMPADTKMLTANVAAAANGSQRSLITAKAGAGSAGVAAASSSAGFGGGAGALAEHGTGAVSSTVAEIGAARAARTGSADGKGKRSAESIEQDFDRQRGAIDALYARALREQPDLQGKLVLELTIAPSGEVTACRVISSELNDPDLERKIVARVKLFKFAAGDFPAITTTKPIQFFPGG